MQGDDMKIYWIKAQAPRRVLALAKHLGIDAQFVQQAGKLRTAEYAQLNPNRKAPTLVDGDYVLWESSAIMVYLCDKAGSDMWPTTDVGEQIELLRWLSWNDNHWAPAVAPFYFEHIVKATFSLGPPDRERDGDPQLRDEPHVHRSPDDRHRPGRAARDRRATGVRARECLAER
jgi:glutathione S-transferase